MASIYEERKKSLRAADELTLTPEQRELLKRARLSKADFMQRLLNRDKRRIVNEDGTYSTHLLGWATDDNNNAIIFPEIQPDEQGNLKNYGKDAISRAVEKRDTLVTTPKLAEWFTTNYKNYFME